MWLKRLSTEVGPPLQCVNLTLIPARPLAALPAGRTAEAGSLLSVPTHSRVGHAFRPLCKLGLAERASSCQTLKLFGHRKW